QTRPYRPSWRRARRAPASVSSWANLRSVAPAVTPLHLAGQAVRARRVLSALDQGSGRFSVGNLEQDLGLDRFHELVALANRNHERALTADDAIPVVDVELRDVEIAGLAQHDRQPVDGDSLRQGCVAGVHD